MRDRVAVRLAILMCLATHGANRLPAADFGDDAERQALLKEADEVAARIDRLKISLPLSGEAAGIEATLKRLAGRAGLADLRIQGIPGRQRVPFADGRPSPVERQGFRLQGRDAFGKLDIFLGFVAIRPWMVEIEALVLGAATDDRVTFDLRLAFADCLEPCSAHVEPGPDPGTLKDATLDHLLERQNRLANEERAARLQVQLENADARKKSLELERTLIEREMRLKQLVLIRTAFLEDLQLEAILQGLSEHDAASWRVVGALAAFSRAVDSRPVALTEVRVAGDTTVRGMALGASGRTALRTALEKSGLPVGTLVLSPAGGCHAFTVSGPVREGDRPAGVEGNGPFDDRTDAMCHADPEPPPAHVVVRGTATAERALALRLRGVELPELFRVLHDLTDAGFVVDPDVAGRVDLDVDGATLEELLGALSQARVRVGAGPLRRVSRPGRASWVARQDHTGTPMNVSFRDEDLIRVLGIFEDVTALKLMALPDLRGRVTVFAKEAPWDLLLEALVASQGLMQEIDRDMVFIGANPAALRRNSSAAIDVRVLRRARPREWWRGRASLDLVGVDDLVPAGRASNGMHVNAYAIGPTGRLWRIEAGQRLLDGRVRALTSVAMTLETAAGALRELSFP